MSKFFKGSVAAVAMGVVLGLPLSGLAQDAAELPALLQSLNLEDVSIKDARHGGKHIKGETAGGLEIRAFVDEAGNIRGIFADDDDDDDKNGALPQAVIDQLIPQAVREQATLGQIATITAIFNDDRGVMVAGTDADGEDVRAGFSADGTLMRFGRGDDFRGGRGWHGKDHRKGRHGDDHGARLHRERHGGQDHGDMGRGDKGPGKGGPRAADLNPDALRETLSAAGYTEVGDISRDGPRSLVLATNPQGEQVVVELNPKGEIVRESAR